MTQTARRPGTAPSEARSPSGAAGSRSPGPGPVAPTAPVSCRCPPMSCSTAPSCSAGWRWSGCWPGSPRAATRSPWSRLEVRSPRRRRSTSESAVSRRFVAMTVHALTDLLAADLTGLDLVALMIDGVHFADHLCVVALGIDIDGVKHPLALVEGSTENTTLVRGLLVALRDRGLDVTRPILAVLDGAKALAAAVQEVFDHPVIARCQLHKLRNVRDHLPEKMRGPVEKRMRAAYHADSALAAEALLEALAKELDKTHPGAAGQPPRRNGRDADRDPPRRATHPGQNPAVDQRHRVHDLDLPRPRPQRQALARRTDGAALVRRRNGRSQRPVPTRERPPPPRHTAHLAGTACRRRNCQRRLQHSRRERSLMLTGPPPKFHGTRDILASGREVSLGGLRDASRRQPAPRGRMISAATK